MDAVFTKIGALSDALADIEIEPFPGPSPALAEIITAAISGHN